MKNEQTIQLQAPENKRGPVFPRKVYDQISSAILTFIYAKPEGTAALEELLMHVGEDMEGVVPWHILKVKVDLQVRGILKISHDRSRRQIIEINPRNQKKLTVL